jgi:hypothetical protein
MIGCMCQGTYRVDELVSACRNADFTDMVFVNETRGVQLTNLLNFALCVCMHMRYMYVCIYVCMYELECI